MFYPGFVSGFPKSLESLRVSEFHDRCLNNFYQLAGRQQRDGQTKVAGGLALTVYECIRCVQSKKKGRHVSQIPPN